MIKSDGLSKKYGDTLAVDQLTFEVKPGVVTGFLGPNGAGKSTTMRMIRTTFIVNPRRSQVLLAKVVIVGFLGMLISGISMTGMFLVSQAILGSYGLETASLGDSDAYRVIIVYALLGGLIYTLIPLSIGFLLRGTVSGITASIGFFFLPFMVGAALPVWIQENVVRYFPDLAMDSLGGLTASDAATHVSDGLAVVVILIWLIAAPTIAAFFLNRRDA